ncbi:DNA helicase [Candidatus Poribacteria bacterium]|nr:MAG: DNA helicase [Candidatus Poribacteria bacterium]
MPLLNLKPTHKPIKDYYATLQQFNQQAITHEGAVSAPFGTLLNICAKQIDATFSQQYQMQTDSGDRIIIDGAVTKLGMPLAYWEAKDIHDDLPQAVQEKQQAGYPLDNILFQTPERGILFQNGQRTLDTDLTDPNNLVNTLQQLFGYTTPVHEDWERAVADFRTHVPDLATEMMDLIETQLENDSTFRTAFTGFYETCKSAINPNLSQKAVEEMLIQHILTERIFRTVFDRSDFTTRNIIAQEIEKVTGALMHQAISRDVFLRPLDPFYRAIENAAKGCRDFSQKQHLLNTFYEQFFQGFSADVADTHGIVYTPQPIVDFMVNSVEHILNTEFDRSLSSEGVHIIDPFVGTGNFIVRLMRDIDGMNLKHKYQNELHCNEVMLLPYYIASLNIEQEYYQRTQQYLPFEGIALADTFEMLEKEQIELFSEENTDRVARQKNTDMFVVIGNPPYNLRQVNESDNNKNRDYKTMNRRISDSFVLDSETTLKTGLYDPYVKAIRWAIDRIDKEGVVAFVTNNGFIDGKAFDGMRKHLADEFNSIFILDLGGNVRKNPKLSGSTHNVFGIQVGVSINLFVKKNRKTEFPHIFYSRVDESWRKEQKYEYLNIKGYYQNIQWEDIIPDNRYRWLTKGLLPEFETFIPMGTKKVKAEKNSVLNVIFKTFSNGVLTGRDAWICNFNRTVLTYNVERLSQCYNTEIDRWQRNPEKGLKIDDFVNYDETRIKWSATLKRHLTAGHRVELTKSKIRQLLYRPYTKTNLYFDNILTERPGVFPYIFPLPKSEKANRVICVNVTPEKPFTCLMSDCIPNLVVTAGFGSPTQCFPFYTYDEDGSNRKENITDWALAAYREHYNDNNINKWDIFHYTYGLLHHPEYREKYQANLKRDLPHIPYAPDFWGFAHAGVELADIHINYEEYPIHPQLQHIETPNVPINLKVEKMKLSKDKTSLVYNDFLTISGIPKEVYEYRLGTRSALEWVVDQYRIKTDKRSGIVNDPNRADDERYIVDLIGRVIGVSLRTVEIVNGLPSL